MPRTLGGISNGGQWVRIVHDLKPYYAQVTCALDGVQVMHVNG
jgi:hypothetical protein